MVSAIRSGRFSLLLLKSRPSRRNCPRCRQPRATKKWMSISRLPESTLVIHLKRFASSPDGSLMGIDTPVVFPVEELDLSSLLPRAPQDGPRTLATFTLCAVVNHGSALRDELDSGHCELTL